MRAGTNRDSKTFTTEKAKDGGKKEQNCSRDQQCKDDREAALCTTGLDCYHSIKSPSFCAAKQALTMALLSFCFTWQQGFEHTIEMLPVISIYPLADLCH